MGKPTVWFPTRSDSNRAVQPQKMARSLKFQMYVEGELYYPSSENKRADQLLDYREADLRLCFRLCRLLVFSRGGSNVYLAQQFIIALILNCFSTKTDRSRIYLTFTSHFKFSDKFHLSFI